MIMFMFHICDDYVHVSHLLVDISFKILLYFIYTYYKITCIKYCCDFVSSDYYPNNV